MRQLEFSFMDLLLTPAEQINRFMCEQSRKEFDEHFLKLISMLNYNEKTGRIAHPLRSL
jgi:hypothetical protein